MLFDSNSSHPWSLATTSGDPKVPERCFKSCCRFGTSVAAFICSFIMLLEEGPYILLHGKALAVSIHSTLQIYLFLDSLGDKILVGKQPRRQPKYDLPCDHNVDLLRYYYLSWRGIGHVQKCWIWRTTGSLLRCGWESMSKQLWRVGRVASFACRSCELPLLCWRCLWIRPACPLSVWLFI